MGKAPASRRVRSGCISSSEGAAQDPWEGVTVPAGALRALPSPPQKHIKEHHEEVRERPCPHPGCNKVFMIDRYLQRHVKLIHTGTGPALAHAHLRRPVGQPPFPEAWGRVWPPRGSGRSGWNRQ